MKHPRVVPVEQGDVSTESHLNSCIQLHGKVSAYSSSEIASVHYSYIIHPWLEYCGMSNYGPLRDLKLAWHQAGSSGNLVKLKNRDNCVSMSRFRRNWCFQRCSRCSVKLAFPHINSDVPTNIYFIISFSFKCHIVEKQRNLTHWLNPDSLESSWGHCLGIRKRVAVNYGRCVT